MKWCSCPDEQENKTGPDSKPGLTSCVICGGQLVWIPNGREAEADANLPDWIRSVPTDHVVATMDCTCSYEDSEEMTAHAPLCALSKAAQ